MTWHAHLAAEIAAELRELADHERADHDAAHFAYFLRRTSTNAERTVKYREPLKRQRAERKATEPGYRESVNAYHREYQRRKAQAKREAARVERGGPG